MNDNKHQFSIFICMLFLNVHALANAPQEKQQSKYGFYAKPLSQEHSYFKDHFPPLFWKMIPYTLHQENEWSCGLVSTAIILNTVRSVLERTSTLRTTDTLFTEKMLIKAIKKSKKFSSLLKDFSKRGITLFELTKLLDEFLKIYQIKLVKMETVFLENDSNLKSKEQILHDRLVLLEKSPYSMIIANFNQGIYTSDIDAGHTSPIGAYDSEKQMVLIFDTDRHWYEPYWVSEKIFLEGLKTSDKISHKNRGYIYLQLQKP